MNPKKLKKSKKIIYNLICAREYKPMRCKEIAILLDIPKDQRRQLQDTLDSLLSDGKIAMDNRGRYFRSTGKAALDQKEKQKKETNADVLTGTFIGHQKGFGFVEVEGCEEDFFISPDHVNGAFHQDIVEILPIRKTEGRRTEAKIVAIKEHTMKEVVGRFVQERSFGFVIPDNRKLSGDIFIPQKECGEAKDGQKVVVALTDYGTRNRNPEGKVTEILGFATEPGVDILSVARSMELPMEFPEKVCNQAKKIRPQISEADCDGRRDLRDVLMVTIDGEDAKDLDDAVSLTVEDGVYHLGVHIADVSNYVQAGSALDREAIKRGTSVYLVDRVLPMLPVELSNGICSLNAGEDRLTLSCLMDFDADANMIRHEIVESVIHVDRRMSYTEVRKILEQEDPELLTECAALVPMFRQMAELSARIRKKRNRRGSIDFDFPECKILLGATGHPIDILPYEHNIATDLIEDFMLSANETIAREYSEREIPFVYRTHDNPDMEKMENVLSFIRTLGIETVKSGKEMTPGEVQKIITQLEGRPCQDMVQRLLLRSMKQAKYTMECSGHFGLAAKYYCHFTSPIRRYPDLQIHRIIKDDIRGRLKPEKIKWYQEHLEGIAGKCSTLERRAQEAERETDKLKMTEYMSYHLEEIFSGRISGVTSWGLFVELPNTVEGLVRLSDMVDDYYTFDEEHYQVIGEHTGRVYQLGDEVTVRVEDADVTTSTIDFSLVNR